MSRAIRSLRRWSSLVALMLVALAGGSAARADETFVFDGAGDAPQISLIGDSTLAGVRWYADYGALRRFNFVLNAESCRRTVEQSCFSREGYRSANVISVMQSLDGQLGEVLVVMSGYNDPTSSIDEAVDTVVDEARRQGVDHVVWLSLRTASDVIYQDPQEQSSVDTFREFNEHLTEAAEASDGYLQVADWATYSNGASAWFDFDGVHLSPAGVDALTTYIAGTVERVLAGDDVSPSAASWITLVPGAEGDIVASVQQAVIDAGVELPGGVDGVYGNETMFAVAEYQRGATDLQVTGAVDLATARSLGVLNDPAEAAEAEDATGVPRETAPTSASAEDAASSPPTADESSSGRAPLLAAVVAIAVVIAIAAMRRRNRAMRGSRRAATRSHTGGRELERIPSSAE